MPNYISNRLPGATYFFTVNLFDRSSSLLIDHVDLLRSCIRRARRRRSFHIDAWVILPEHMHCIWTLPPGDTDYSSRWKDIKTAFAKGVSGTEARTGTMIRRGERGIWQRRFWEHTIRGDADYAAHMDYLHNNPYKHGLVPQVKLWPYSTFHRCVAAGIYPANWGGEEQALAVGERPMVEGAGRRSASLFHPTNTTVL
jgi:putative transposase